MCVVWVCVTTSRMCANEPFMPTWLCAQILILRPKHHANFYGLLSIRGFPPSFHPWKAIVGKWFPKLVSFCIYYCSFYSQVSCSYEAVVLFCMSLLSCLVFVLVLSLHASVNAFSFQSNSLIDIMLLSSIMLHITSNLKPFNIHQTKFIS